MTDTDLEMLNAYVDGELSPDARALVETRIASDVALAHRVEALRRMKRQVAAMGSESVVLQIPVDGMRMRPVAIAAAAAILCLVFLGGWLGALTFANVKPRMVVASEIAQALALYDHRSAVVMDSSLRATRIDDFQAPELTKADLVLVSLRSDVDISGMRAVQADYQGPHGCRLSLFRIPQGGSGQGLRIIDENNVQSAAWADKSFRYIAVARRLNLTRFAVLASAMQAMTAKATDSTALGVVAALEDAHQPCTG